MADVALVQGQQNAVVALPTNPQNAVVALPTNSVVVSVDDDSEPEDDKVEIILSGGGGKNAVKRLDRDEISYNTRELCINFQKVLKFNNTAATKQFNATNQFIRVLNRIPRGVNPDFHCLNKFETGTINSLAVVRRRLIHEDNIWETSEVVDNSTKQIHTHDIPYKARLNSQVKVDANGYFKRMWQAGIPPAHPLNFNFQLDSYPDNIRSMETVQAILKAVMDQNATIASELNHMEIQKLNGKENKEYVTQEIFSKEKREIGFLHKFDVSQNPPYLAFDRNRSIVCKFYMSKKDEVGVQHGVGPENTMYGRPIWLVAGHVNAQSDTIPHPLPTALAFAFYWVADYDPERAKSPSEPPVNQWSNAKLGCYLVVSLKKFIAVSSQWTLTPDNIAFDWRQVYDEVPWPDQIARPTPEVQSGGDEFNINLTMRLLKYKEREQFYKQPIRSISIAGTPVVAFLGGHYTLKELMTALIKEVNEVPDKYRIQYKKEEIAACLPNRQLLTDFYDASEINETMWISRLAVHETQRFLHVALESTLVNYVLRNLAFMLTLECMRQLYAFTPPDTQTNVAFQKPPQELNLLIPSHRKRVLAVLGDTNWFQIEKEEKTFRDNKAKNEFEAKMKDKTFENSSNLMMSNVFHMWNRELGIYAFCNDRSSDITGLDVQRQTVSLMYLVSALSIVDAKFHVQNERAFGDKLSPDTVLKEATDNAVAGYDEIMGCRVAGYKILNHIRAIIRSELTKKDVNVKTIETLIQKMQFREMDNKETIMTDLFKVEFLFDMTHVRLNLPIEMEDIAIDIDFNEFTKVIPAARLVNHYLPYSLLYGTKPSATYNAFINAQRNKYLKDPLAKQQSIENLKDMYQLDQDEEMYYEIIANQENCISRMVCRAYHRWIEMTASFSDAPQKKVTTMPNNKIANSKPESSGKRNQYSESELEPQETMSPLEVNSLASFKRLVERFNDTTNSINDIFWTAMVYLRDLYECELESTGQIPKPRAFGDGPRYEKWPPHLLESFGNMNLAAQRLEAQISNMFPTISHLLDVQIKGGELMYCLNFKRGMAQWRHAGKLSNSDAIWTRYVVERSSDTNCWYWKKQLDFEAGNQDISGVKHRKHYGFAGWIGSLDHPNAPLEWVPLTDFFITRHYIRTNGTPEYVYEGTNNNWRLRGMLDPKNSTYLEPVIDGVIQPHAWWFNENFISKNCDILNDTTSYPYKSVGGPYADCLNWKFPPEPGNVYVRPEKGYDDKTSPNPVYYWARYYKLPSDPGVHGSAGRSMRVNLNLFKAVPPGKATGQIIMRPQLWCLNSRNGAGGTGGSYQTKIVTTADGDQSRAQFPVTFTPMLPANALPQLPSIMDTGTGSSGLLMPSAYTIDADNFENVKNLKFRIPKSTDPERLEPAKRDPNFIKTWYTRLVDNTPAEQIVGYNVRLYIYNTNRMQAYGTICQKIASGRDLKAISTYSTLCQKALTELKSAMDLGDASGTLYKELRDALTYEWEVCDANVAVSKMIEKPIQIVFEADPQAYEYTNQGLPKPAYILKPMLQDFVVQKKEGSRKSTLNKKELINSWYKNVYFSRDIIEHIRFIARAITAAYADDLLQDYDRYFDTLQQNSGDIREAITNLLTFNIEAFYAMQGLLVAVDDDAKRLPWYPRLVEAVSAEIIRISATYLEVTHQTIKPYNIRPGFNPEDVFSKPKGNSGSGSAGGSVITTLDIERGITQSGGQQINVEGVRLIPPFKTQFTPEISMFSADASGNITGRLEWDRGETEKKYNIKNSRWWNEVILPGFNAEDLAIYCARIILSQSAQYRRIFSQIAGNLVRTDYPDFYRLKEKLPLETALNATAEIFSAFKTLDQMKRREGREDDSPAYSVLRILMDFFRAQQDQLQKAIQNSQTAEPDNNSGLDTIGDFNVFPVVNSKMSSSWLSDLMEVDESQILQKVRLQCSQQIASQTKDIVDQYKAAVDKIKQGIETREGKENLLRTLKYNNDVLDLIRQNLIEQVSAKPPAESQITRIQMILSAIQSEQTRLLDDISDFETTQASAREANKDKKKNILNSHSLQKIEDTAVSLKMTGIKKKPHNKFVKSKEKAPITPRSDPESSPGTTQSAAATPAIEPASLTSYADWADELSD